MSNTVPSLRVGRKIYVEHKTVIKRGENHASLTVRLFHERIQFLILIR